MTDIPYPTEISVTQPDRNNSFKDKLRNALRDKLMRLLPELKQKLAEDHPEKVPEKIADVDVILQEESPQSEISNSFRQIKPGETFPGSMPIVDLPQETYKQIIDLYPGTEHSGKSKVVFVDTNTHTAHLFFFQPEHIRSVYEAEFAAKYGGKAGLPEFYGVHPNGYDCEAIEGITLTQAVNEKYARDNNVEGLFTPEQGQQLLDIVAEYHETTHRVHGDLGKFDNIIIQPDDRIRIIDTEWEKIGDQTPQKELDYMYLYLTDTLKIPGLKKPHTISDEEAEKGLEDFRNAVKEKCIFDPVFKYRVISIAGTLVEIKTDENKSPMVKVNQSSFK